MTDPARENAPLAGTAPRGGGAAMTDPARENAPLAGTARHVARVARR
jgi:hypothetical protein